MDPGARASVDPPHASPDELARLFRQVRTARRREEAIFRAFRARYGLEVLDVTGLDERDFAVRDREESLGAMVANEDASGWLRALVERQARSEAILLAHLLRRYGREGRALSAQAARGFGRECGREGRARFPAGRAEDFLAALEEASLHGLPRQAPSIVELRAGALVIHRARCPSERTWRLLGSPILVLCAVERSWIEGFCRGYGSGIRYRPGPRIAAGAFECRDEFVLRAEGG